MIGSSNIRSNLPVGEDYRMAGRIQLRMYIINKGQMGEFLNVWREKVCPLRAKYGFHVEGGWIPDNENRFFWLIRYDGDDWDTAEAAYFASEERKTMTPSPAGFVAHMELRFVRFEPAAKA
jgi:hypothetical protein